MCDCAVFPYYRTLTDDWHRLLIDDSTRQKVEVELFTIDDDCVSSIVATLEKVKVEILVCMFIKRRHWILSIEMAVTEQHDNSMFTTNIPNANVDSIN